MNHDNYERASLDDAKALAARIGHLSIDEIIRQLGPPVRTFPGFKETRKYRDHTETVEFARVLEFDNLSENVHSVLVYEKLDGGFEVNVRGKTKSDADTP
jgi:hypothetical protein